MHTRQHKLANKLVYNSLHTKQCRKIMRRDETHGENNQQLESSDVIESRLVIYQRLVVALSVRAITSVESCVQSELIRSAALQLKLEYHSERTQLSEDPKYREYGQFEHFRQIVILRKSFADETRLRASHPSKKSTALDHLLYWTP